MALWVTIADYYNAGFSLIEDGEQLNKYLKRAQRTINLITYNRIDSIGFENISSYEYEIIEECLFEQAEFLYENEEIISSILSKFSINSVSMELNPADWKINVDKGYVIPNSILNKLQTLRFCSLDMNYRWDK